MVDQNGQEVGVATEPFGGILLRKVGQDAVMFYASSGGPDTGPIDFYHTATDCSDERRLQIFGGRGFAYFASVHHGAIFYTKAIDTGAQPVTILASEHFEQIDDAMLPGTCTVLDGPAQMLVGVATGVSDPALGNLALPLRIK